MKKILLSVLGALLLLVGGGAVVKTQVGQKLGFSNQTAQPYVISAQSSSQAATTTSLFGDFLPQVDSVFNIGSSAYKWNNGFFAGTLTVGSCTGCTAGTGVTDSQVLFSNNGTIAGDAGMTYNSSTDALQVVTSVSSSRYIVGAGSSASASLQFSGDPDTGIFTGGANSVNIVAGAASVVWDGTAFRGGSNNSRDLGSGSIAWRSIYSSTTAFLNDLQVTNSVIVNKTITAGGTTGAQTINKSAGCVNFAAAATSLVVTNSLVSATSLVFADVSTNDTTLKSVQAVPGSGSFTLYGNAAATAETKVCFLVTN